MTAMEKPKRYKNVGMSVEDRIYDIICDGCDQDPAMCYNQGYCEYDKEEIVEDDDKSAEVTTVDESWHEDARRRGEKI